jgi:hypothetical protein
VSVWAEIDRLKAKHEAELEETRAALGERRGGALRIQHGLWCCSWRPTRGDRHVQHVRARTSAELLERLDQLIAGWPRKRRGREAAAS